MRREFLFKGKWLFENSNIPYSSSGAECGLRIKKKLFSGKSLYQQIEVYDTIKFGRILTLDKIFQTSEEDEFIYHEMICHLPIFYFLNENKKLPEKVLIIGGGDGGALEEVLKHRIKKVWMLEIDKMVSDVSVKYLPSISRGAFKDKRANVLFEDGKSFIEKNNNFFDIIILDLSDPGGPAKDLISEKFYRNVKKALTKKGIISVQSGSLDCQIDLVALIFKRLKNVFPFVKIHHAPIPLYGLGEFSLTIAANFNLPKKIREAIVKKSYTSLKPTLRYWSPEIHNASGILPPYLVKRVAI
jgi:spermidine synthase